MINVEKDRVALKVKTEICNFPHVQTTALNLSIMGNFCEVVSLRSITFYNWAGVMNLTNIWRYMHFCLITLQHMDGYNNSKFKNIKTSYLNDKIGHF